jgi:hypothetical protein
MSLVLMGSTSGSVTLQEPAVAGSTVLDLPATSGTVGLTVSQIAFKNRIINGAMVIDQRNNGASISATAGGVYPVDRFIVRENTDGTATTQRSTVAPAGFVNSLLFTVTGADSSLTTDQFTSIDHRLEGFNIADFGWGTDSAKTITISFWVRSSVTGTFVVAPQNNAFNRCYPATYTISSANTWEYKTVTIPGDTSGTWLTDNGVGMFLTFTLGSGPTYQGTANTWNAAGVISTAGATNLMATNGATFYITGVQLEVGSVATTFDFRAYGTELALCQRYYEELDVLYFTTAWPTTPLPANYKVTKRSSPTIGNFMTLGSGGQFISQTNTNSLFLAVANSQASGGKVTLSAEL